jgi:hypothetical protein
MPDGKRRSFTLCLSASLMLLAAVLVAPIRVSGLVAAPSRPDCLRGIFIRPRGRHTSHLDRAKATRTARQPKAVACGNEEEDRTDAHPEAGVSVPLPRSFRRVADRPLIARRSLLSLYPLRC